MRMPLNVTGIPILLDPANTWITVLDNSDQPEDLSSHPRFLTLFFLATRQDATTAGAGCSITVRVENTDSGATILLSSFTLPAVTALGLGSALRQYPLRGNVRVQIQTDTVSTDQPVFVYGYYEIDRTDQRIDAFPSDTAVLGFGEGLRNSRTQRSFQPDLGQISVDSIPASLSGIGQETVHQFSTDYLDSIDLHFQGTTTGGPATATGLWFYDGGDRIATIDYIFTGPSVIRLFQNIPMKAAAIPSILFPALPAGIYLVGQEANDRSIAWGRFFRG